MSQDPCPRCGLPLDNQHPIGCRDILSPVTDAERTAVRELLGGLRVVADPSYVAVSGDYADLRALAEAAEVVTDHDGENCARWDLTGAGREHPHDWLDGTCEWCDTPRLTRDGLVAFVAAANPARILALLADLEAARARAREWRGSLDRVTAQWDDERHKRVETQDAARALAAKVETLTAEVERLRGPFPCCEHCADDQPHVEKDSHDLPCDLCDEQRDALAAKVDAVRALYDRWIAGEPFLMAEVGAALDITPKESSG